MKIEDFNFAGHKAIVRVDFNVPLDENGNVTDDTRIRGALPTLKKVLADGGALIMMSHMGKPKGKVKPELSLSQIVKNVSDALGVEVKFAKDCGNADAEAAALKPGEALLLENLRFYPEEEGKPVGVEKGTPEYDAAKAEMKERQKKFAAKLASYADVYVMDAFGTAHRKHASTAVIADSFDKDHKMLGFLMEKEVKAVDAVLGNIKRHPIYRWLPVVMIMWCILVQYVTPIHQAVGHLEIFWSRVPIFFIGINMGEMVRQKQTLDGTSIWMIWLMFLMTLLASIFLEQEKHGMFPLFLERMLYIPLTITSILLLNRIFRRTPGWFNKGFMFVGALSLECYLLHIHFVLKYIEPYHLGYWPTFFICIGITLPAAWILSKIAGWISKELAKFIK